MSGRRGLSTVFLVLFALSARAESLSVEVKGASLAGQKLHVKVVHDPRAGSPLPLPATVLLDGTKVDEIQLASGEQEIAIERARPSSGSHRLTIRAGEMQAETDFRAIPGWLSIIPPIIAIALALIFRDVLISLFAGIFVGAMILFNWNPLVSFARSIDHFIAPALANEDHAKIIIFSALLGGMVGVISKNGGSQGIVHRLRGWATNPRRGQVATWMMGVLIFFDDYANALIVGPTMRPITDRLRISREKLAYIVDSTSAPVTSIFPISTWIGFEVGLIAAAISSLGIDNQYNAYQVFIDSIPFRFYPIFALVLGFTIAFTCRDFGPMLRAELRASETGKVMADDAEPLGDFSTSALIAPESIPKRAINALLPIATVIIVTLIGLYATGAPSVANPASLSAGEWIREVLANANSYNALLWASLAGCIVAIVLTISQRLLRLRDTMHALIEGFKSMFLAMAVLVLAWSIGGVTTELHTADYVVGLAEGVISPHWLGVLVFLLAAAISFATGTSWGTMAILMPLVIPIAHALSLGANHPVGSAEYSLFMVATISSVLAGSVWGDHCSPISDTTILSSMATGCDHIAHVRTQLPYALGVGVLGMLIGDIPTGFGLSPWISLLLGAAIIIAVVVFFGKRSDWQPDDHQRAASNVST